MSAALLYHADCFDVMPAMAGESIDFILADLPFGTTRCEWDNPAMRHERRKSASVPPVIDIPKLWIEYRRLLKPGGAIALFSSQRFTAQLIMSNFENFAYTWSWDKKFAGNFAQAKRMPLLVCEEISIFSTTGILPRYFPIMTERTKPIRAGGNSQTGKAIQIQNTPRSRAYGAERPIYTTKSPTNLLPFSCREERGLHRTQKPVSLCEYLIRTYTLEGDTVLDNCMGSGSSGVASINIGRRFIGIESDRASFDIAAERISGRPARHESESKP